MIVNLVNGDRITARVRCEDIALQTVFADVVLCFSYIEEISVHTGTLTAGLMLHYDFNDDEDGIVVDRSGHEHHGTAKGNLRYVEQPDGFAIQTSSRETYVMGNSPKFSLNDRHQLTAAVRVKLQWAIAVNPRQTSFYQADALIKGSKSGFRTHFWG